MTYRAARRYFGSWMKSDKLIPSTFKQPDAPDTKLTSFTSDASGDPQVRYALRGLARNDKDYAASQVLNFILEDRLKDNGVANPTVRHMAHVLPGRNRSARKSRYLAPRQGDHE